LILIPTNLIYWLAFTYLDIKRVKALIQEENEDNKYDDDFIEPEKVDEKELADAIINHPLNKENFKHIWPQISKCVVNLGLV
jgi:hypothetical protein